MSIARTSLSFINNAQNVPSLYIHTSSHFQNSFLHAPVKSLLRRPLKVTYSPFSTLKTTTPCDKSLILRRSFTSTTILNNTNSAKTQRWRQHLHLFTKTLAFCKSQSTYFGRLILKNCSWVAAHRIRRTLQLYWLYSGIWNRQALDTILRNCTKRITSRLKNAVLATTILVSSAYDWRDSGISEDYLEKFMGDLDFIDELKAATIVCSKCQEALVVDRPLPGKQYCQCPVKGASYDRLGADHAWSPFLEREDVIVWRREVPEHRGFYAYKVYGRYPDVDFLSFLHVQLDVMYRKVWDPTAVELRVIDSHPESHSDILYWEMQWPRFFANRDYVYVRRWTISQHTEKKNDATNVVPFQGIVVSRSTQHPRCPERSKTRRVQDYWSVLVVRPLEQNFEAGIEFCLTYFDHPGLSVPAPITAWVAMQGMPDFLAKLRRAACSVKHLEQKDERVQKELENELVRVTRPRAAAEQEEKAEEEQGPASSKESSHAEPLRGSPSVKNSNSATTAMENNCTNYNSSTFFHTWFSLFG